MNSAHTAVTLAVRHGALPRPSVCEACGTTSGRIVYHHWSYLPEHYTDVIPLCEACHRRVHVGKLAEPRTGRVYERPNMAPPQTSLFWLRPRGQTAEDAARACGISEARLRKIEALRERPTCIELIRLLIHYCAVSKGVEAIRSLHDNVDAADALAAIAEVLAAQTLSDADKVKLALRLTALCNAHHGAQA